MLRDLLTQKCAQNFLVTDFGYPRACRFRKYQNLNRSPALVLPTFFKTWFKFIKCGQNWPIFELFGNFLHFSCRGTDPETVLNEYNKKMRLFQKIKKSIFANFSYILKSKNHVLKKVFKLMMDRKTQIWPTTEVLLPKVSI
jgi:hypothetical protein